jgi:tetratricopeptide (TPR) repeat protein
LEQRHVDDQNSSDVNRRVAALLEVAEARAGEHRIAEAKSAYREASELDATGHARNEYGRFLTIIEDFPDAIAQFSCLLADAKRAANNMLVAVAANNLAAIHRQLGRRALAAQYQQQAICAENRCLELAGPSITALSNRAGDAILAGDLKLARTLLVKSLVMDNQQQSLADLGADWGNLGVLSALEGDPDAAMRYLWRAYHFHADAGDEHGMGCDLMNLGEVLCHTGRWRAASSCFKQASKRFDRVPAHRSARRAQLQAIESERTADVLEQDPSMN